MTIRALRAIPTILLLELKRFVPAYVRLAFFAIAALAAGAFILAAAVGILERESPYAGFTVGVVDGDGSMETKLLLDSFREKTAILAEMTEPQAADALRKGEIPAYIVIPEGFAGDVKSGANTPFTLYGNPSLPIQWRLTQILAQGGVAYLSASQAGIYGTMDYARAHGMAWEDVTRNFLYPVNAAFAKFLIDDSRFYRVVTLTATNGQPLGAFYGVMFAAFFGLLAVQAFFKPLSECREVFARYKTAGVPTLLVHALDVLAVWVGMCAFLSPLFILQGRMVVFAALLLACFAAFLAEALKNAAAASFAVFGAAAVMLYVSGGVVPPAYLPGVFSKLQYFTFNYWLLNIQSPASLLVFVGGGAVLFAAGWGMKRAAKAT